MKAIQYLAVKPSRGKSMLCKLQHCCDKGHIFNVEQVRLERRPVENEVIALDEHEYQVLSVKGRSSNSKLPRVKVKKVVRPS